MHFWDFHYVERVLELNSSDYFRRINNNRSACRAEGAAEDIKAVLLGFHARKPGSVFCPLQVAPDGESLDDPIDLTGPHLTGKYCCWCHLDFTLCNCLSGPESAGEVNDNDDDSSDHDFWGGVDQLIGELSDDDDDY